MNVYHIVIDYFGSHLEYISISHNIQFAAIAHKHDMIVTLDWHFVFFSSRT